MEDTMTNAMQTAEILVEALPYIKKFYGKTVVIKYGGHAMNNDIMKEKVILMCIDGMRPDGFLSCGNPFIHKMMELGSYCLESRSVFPSSTLPCHMSMFHSVTPERHGTTTNTYMPQVRPVKGLCEVLKDARKTCAMFYNWEQLRDVSRPGSLAYSYMVKGCHEDAPKSAIST